MNKTIIATTTAIGIFFVSVLATWYLSKPIFDETLPKDGLMPLEIAPPNLAITLARLKNSDVVLVLKGDEDNIHGINISQHYSTKFRDSVHAYNTIGRASLVKLSLNTRSSFSWSELSIPIEDQYPHIAAGTNFKAHAEEVGHTGEPFLFPKLSNISAWNADVLDGTRLDYEVELCAVPLTNYTGKAKQLGFLLCGDFTDRWTLVTKIDMALPMGQTGFPQAKGGNSRFPVGALLVIPQSEVFYQEFDLKLYVNGEMRQNASASQLIWSPNEILKRALLECNSPYYNDENIISVSDCNSIPARTLILTGTPEGIMFKVATIWNPLSYLHVGDQITSTGKYLGIMKNTISAQ